MIEAMQWTGSNTRVIVEWVNSHRITGFNGPLATYVNVSDRIALWIGDRFAYINRGDCIGFRSPKRWPFPMRIDES